jgi:hypothetical protein
MKKGSEPGFTFPYFRNSPFGLQTGALGPLKWCEGCLEHGYNRFHDPLP